MKRRSELVVRLVLLAFGDGTVWEEIALATMVLLQKKRGLSGDWACGGLVEGVYSSGEYLLEKDCRVVRCTSLVQGRAGGEDGYFGGQSGTEAGRDLT